MTNKRIIEWSNWQIESLVLLTLATGRVVLHQTVKDMSTMDERWGYKLVARMGRLDVPESSFSIRVLAAKVQGSVTLHLKPHSHFQKVVTTEELLMEAKIDELLLEPEIFYTLHLGTIYFDEPDTMSDVRITIEIQDGDGKAHGGLVHS